MGPDLNYEGRVVVKRGFYKGHNGIKVGHCVHYITKRWMCLVSFYEGSDIYAIPFSYLEKIDINGRI